MKTLFNGIAGAFLLLAVDKCADGNVDAINSVGKSALEIGVVTLEEGIEAFNSTLRWGQSFLPR